MSRIGHIAIICLLGVGLLLPLAGCGQKETSPPPPKKVKRDPHGFGQALWIAAARCDLPTIRRLIEAGAEVNIKLGPYLTTPLMENVQAPDHRCPSQVALTLIQAGAKLNTQDLRGNTALHWVADHNCEPVQIEVTRLLLQRGADPMIKNIHKQTAFDLAVEDNCTAKMGIIADYMARRLPRVKPTQKMPPMSEKPIQPDASGTMATPSSTTTAPSTTMMAPTTTMPVLPAPLESEKGMPGGYSTGTQWKKPGQ